MADRLTDRPTDWFVCVTGMNININFAGWSSKQSIGVVNLKALIKNNWPLSDCVSASMTTCTLLTNSMSARRWSTS